MPLLIVHTNSDEQTTFMSSILEEFVEFSAKKLSCKDIALDTNEISVRVIKSEISKPIAEIEVIIAVHSFKERIERQDVICVEFKEFLENKSDKKYTFFVWLQLSELGHSQ